jgi:low temperature requirement protein LtrA
MTEDAAKRVSWVELYFDLVFVFAVGQTAHTIAAAPHWGGLATALGLFVPLWWTWIGFVVLYNRRGEDTVADRLLILAGTVPCAIAAIEVHAAEAGHSAGFALAMAGARAVLAFAFRYTSDRGPTQSKRIALGYVVSTVVFAGSAALSGPGRYVAWGLALAQEAGFLLLGQRRRRSTRPRNRAEAVKSMMDAPTDPELAVNAAHLAERFGLFMIILLGEIVVSVGAAAIAIEHRSIRYWMGLILGLILAAALWWIYFTSAAEIDEYALRASGGNPAMAYGLYAGGHLGPAFALLTIAAGVSLVLEEHPPASASWFITGGLAAYLVGARAIVIPGTGWIGRLLRIGVVAATVGLALFQPLTTAIGVLVLVTAWAIVAAVVVSSQRSALLSQIAADPMSILRRPLSR